MVEKYGWDEKGYLIYAYNDEGRKIGAHECREGQIFLNPQTWAVLSGITKRERQERAMDCAEAALSYDLARRSPHRPILRLTAVSAR